MDHTAYWINTTANHSAAAYSIFRLNEDVDGMTALREMFPRGEADPLNFVLFSTSGVHGSYATIEEVERVLRGAQKQDPEDYSTDITFLIIHPRVVAFRYGTCCPESQADIDYLKRLRASSHNVIVPIGYPAAAVAQKTVRKL